ncbi:MAG TPA: TetR/AcrR family transcriptional regulator [Dehalococcoidia bacterium]|nr:TetR/AcrR family transcriptional regulator [Dehalococcoidia bacterium]
MNEESAAARHGRRAAQGARTRRAILAAAMNIASVEGLEGLSLGRLAGELQISKSGLFAHFGSKEELQLATLDAAAAAFDRAAVQPALEAEPGLPRLLRLCDGWLGFTDGSVFRGGCFFAAAAADFDGRPGPVRDRVASIMRGWLGSLEEAIREAIAAGHLQPKADPAQLAFELNALQLGANWARQLLDDGRAFARARAALHEHLRAGATAAGRRLIA